jgi:hypothetical protein
MRPPNQRSRRAWVRDPFLFGMALTSLSFITIVLAVTGRLFGDPALLALAVVSVAPAFWLFYQRGQAMARSGPPDRTRRR